MARLARVCVAALRGGASAVCLQPVLLACTAFCAVDSAGHVLVGNNEDWSNPRSKVWPPLPAVTAVFRERFGLGLTPARVEMETLVIDHVRRDPALFLLSQAGRLPRSAPMPGRDGVRRLLTID